VMLGDGRGLAVTKLCLAQVYSTKYVEWLGQV